MLCLISSTSPSVSCSTPKISEQLWMNRWREQRNGTPSTTPMTDPITWSHKTVNLFLLFLSWHLCQVSRFRMRWSQPWSSEDISSSEAEDNPEWNYQEQGECFASSRVCHYQPAINTSSCRICNGHLWRFLQMNRMRSSNEFPSVENEQPTAII